MFKLFKSYYQRAALNSKLSLALRVGVCMIFLSSSHVWTAELKKVTHYTLHYPPYWQVSDSGLSGLHYDMSKILYAKAGLEVNFVVMPYARIEAKKSDPSTQIISFGSASPGSDILLFPMPATVISLSGYSTREKPPASISGYNLSVVALKRGFPLGPYAEILTNKNIATVELSTVDAAIQLLLFNRVDYVITLQDPFEAALEKYKPLKSPMFETNLVRIYGHPIAINKANKDAVEIQTRLSQAYKELVEEGVIIHKSEQTLLTKDHNFFIKE